MDHEKIAERIVESAAKASPEDIEKLRKMTDQNEHSEALLYLYEKILKNKRAANAIKNIIGLRDFFGNMPKQLDELEYKYFYTPAMKQVEREFDEETAKEIYHSF